ncbi:MULTISPECIES: LacI family DNA-binding transcriptional regulator [unclassified Sinorhizobium]|uniref:LacI family DNA-binding transcriptional regulator n=1 Tax=unclassified Sinorhizobium TaxID=2613772 RepID=UPI003523D27F
MASEQKKGRRTRLDDIAARCGVSISTVSRALAGEKGVRPEIRKLVIETANAISYAVPASVAGKKVILVASSAAMIDYVRSQFTLYVLEGLNARAATLGIEVLMRPVANSTDQMRVVTEMRDDPSLGGMLILTLDDEDMLAVAAGLGKPVVLVNSDDPYMRFSSVTPCNRSAAFIGTERLIKAGHERILFMLRPGRRTIERRMEGWCDALRHHGLKANADLVLEVDDWLPELGAETLTRHVQQNGLSFTAILTAGDSLANGAVRGLQAMGYDVPRDVSVVGIDDLPQSAFLNPPLSTVHIPIRELGATALDLLRDMMLGLTLPTRRVELGCHLVERSSIAVARSQA